MVTIGRNDRCPCGSGRKYKVCHLRIDEDSPARRAASLHALDGRVVARLLLFGEDRFADAPLAASLPFVADADTPYLEQLLAPWGAYERLVEGRPLVDWFLDEQARRVEPAELAWIEAQRAAWLSIWEVLDVQVDVGLSLRDLLSGEERFVHEVKGTRGVGKRDALCVRVVDHQGLSLLCGMHPRPLPPREADDVVGAMRRLLDVPKRPVPVGTLRANSDMLLITWQTMLNRLDARPPPRFNNTDGDPLVFTTDRFSFDPAQRPELEARLSRAQGLQRDDDAEPGQATFVVLRDGNKLHEHWENTVVGRATLDGASLLVETNSTRRATALRRRIERLCAGLVTHIERTRQPADDLVLDQWRSEDPGETAPPPEIPPELVAAVLEDKRQHYEAWLDRPIDALDGLTPRAAARRAKSRPKLDLLLRDLEHHESRLPSPEQFDVSHLRTALRLPG